MNGTLHELQMERARVRVRVRACACLIKRLIPYPVYDGGLVKVIERVQCLTHYLRDHHFWQRLIRNYGERKKVTVINNHYR